MPWFSRSAVLLKVEPVHALAEISMRPPAPRILPPMSNESELEQVEAMGIAVSGSKNITCEGNACGITKVKSTQGYPKPPKARIKNTGDVDVRVEIYWSNHVGSGRTTHEVWAGETETVDGPTQYWGVSKYKATKL